MQQSRVRLAGHQISPRSLDTVVCDEKKLQELNDSHGRGVYKSWRKHRPLMRGCLLRREQGHLVESDDAIYVDH